MFLTVRSPHSRRQYSGLDSVEELLRARLSGQRVDAAELAARVGHTAADVNGDTEIGTSSRDEADPLI